MISVAQHSHKSCRILSAGVTPLSSTLQKYSPVDVRFCSWKNFTLEEELTLEVKQSIEKKWGKQVYGVDCPAEHKKFNKLNEQSTRYVLSMFPYPSGRLHLGHVRVYTLSDVLARFHRLQGHYVIHPMGWDAFGLPAENAARDHNVDAEKWTRENISHMKNQIISMGCCFDWDREFATCDPTYYKWTQWLFSKLWENGLAYKKRAYVYWDPVDKTVLAEEQVDNEMRSWRSGAKVEKKLLQQWFIKTAVFAEKLSLGLKSGQLKQGWRDVVDLQENWIGKIHGYFTDCSVDLKDYIVKSDDDIGVSTEEPLRVWFSSVDALKNAKFLILRSDHFLNELDNVSTNFPNGYKLMKFTIKNPATGADLPVFSGPADKLPCVPMSSDCRTDEVLDENFPVEELLANETSLVDISELYKGLNPSTTTPSSANTPAKFTYHPASLRLRDWLVSRQRNWGTPIPAVECQDCSKISVLEKELPVSNKSAETPSSAKCSHCGSTNVKRETDTLDTFFDSSWYFFRYLDPKNEHKIFDQEKTKSLPVNVYIGGKEHATLHLYYARFVNQFLHSIGLSPVTEPFEKLIPIGMVLGEAFILKGSGKYMSKDDCKTEEKLISYKETGDKVYTKWEKMSKSKYNGIDPDTVLQQYGIDTTRLLTMSEAGPTSPRKWPPNNVAAFLKWQTKLWITLREFVDAKDFGDIVFIDDEVWKNSEESIFDARNHYLKGINHDYSSTSQISVAISKLQGLFASLKKVQKSYIKESIEYERALGAGIICLYPIMPAFSAQLWQSFRAVATFAEPEFDLDNEVWDQQWPSVDWRYRLDLICKIRGEKEEIIAKVERNYLDTLDQESALEIALEQPEVRKLFPSGSGSCEIVKFNVEPEFRATLWLREKRQPSDSDPSPTGDGDNDTTFKESSNLKI